MLRITLSTHAAGAKSYYSTADYYTEGQELVGNWRGKGAILLGLSGEVKREGWDALCDNRNPATGTQLTQRQKSERRVGYDFNFHVPKSVSLLYALTSDERILDAFRDSVGETMRDIESEMQTRVRTDGRNEDRTTGNMTWGEFVHFTARPVDGVPDPHLHAHCFVFNTTFDDQEGRWKAGQFAGIKRDAPYFEAVFHARLARRMAELGLPVQRSKTAWELEGVSAQTVRKFSRRTERIEEKARREGITDPELKGAIGAKTRQRKRDDLTMDELRELWRQRLTDDEREGLNGVTRQLGGERIAENGRMPGEAVTWAAEHCFERTAVVPERRLLAEAIKHSIGSTSPEAVERELAGRRFIAAERDGRRFVTTKEILAEERRMIDFARSGRGTCPRLGESDHVFTREWLNDGQGRAVRHVLESPDRVIMIRGAAGTGKTSMMQEAVEAIETNGPRVFTFAPSADASRGVLRQEGFADAETVAKLLADPTLQAEICNQVIWIDEAGLLSSRTMWQVFDLAERTNARVILSGDRGQHGSVERGAALRLLEEEAGVKPAEIREIQRQKGEYRQAVHALSEGRTDEGYRRLADLGWIREVDEPERYKLLAEDYLTIVESGQSALVVSPTHLEGEWITDEIRSRLKAAGLLGLEDRRFLSLQNKNLTQAERADPVNYEPGDVLVFHQNAKGIRKGERLVVGDEPLPLAEADKFQVYRPAVLPVAAGDLLRVTRNGMTADGKHRLNNGGVFTVKDVTPQGDISLTNGWIVAGEFGHLAHGYVATSHASQGKTVDRVLIGQSSDSFPASSREQFYVSVSRGRRGVTVYTDDRRALLEAVSRSDDRLTATEFASESDREQRERTTSRDAPTRAFDPADATGRIVEEVAIER